MTSLMLFSGIGVVALGCLALGFCAVAVIRRAVVLGSIVRLVVDDG